MRIALGIILFFLFVQTSGQIFHRADSLNIKYYNEYLRKRKLKLHIWVQYGRYSELKKPELNRTSKVDTLNIVSLVKSGEKFQSASFDDFGEPLVKNFDTCSLYEFLQINKDSIPQLKDYFSQRKKAAESTSVKTQPSGYFEIIFIKLGRAEYAFSLDNVVYDSYGTYIKNELWYPKVRVLIDYTKRIATKI